MYFVEYGRMPRNPMYFAYELYKLVETGVQTVGRRVQTVQTMKEENKARTSISFDLGLYGLYMLTTVCTPVCTVCTCRCKNP